MKRQRLIASAWLAFSLTALANPVIVKMNSVTTTMSLKEKVTGKDITLPEPVNKEYSFELEPGDYLLTGYGTDGKTVNGTIVMNITDSTTVQQKTIITCTAYVSNKDDNAKSWTQENGDYKLRVKVNTREGENIFTEPGASVTANRYTFLAFNGNSYYAEFEPSDAHKAEGYMTLYRGGTLTANVNVTGAIPKGGEFSITVPSGAELQLGMKFTHFTDFTPVAPDRVESGEGGKIYRYTLANGQVYNYRTWKKGGLTHGGYFTMNLDDAKRPSISFSEEDYAKHDPLAINHSVTNNNGYETGDLFLNINPQGYLKLKTDDEFLVHAMRTWELSDNSTNNYFFEPDFHYTILDTDFRPCDKIIAIENCDNVNGNSAWSKITAKGEGTAIVLVTYDGINLNYYNNADKKDYLGGEYWGAIWPENTGVFVVSVGGSESAVKPNMVINQQYNVGALRLAGEYLDAEHDVLYYLDTTPGFDFTFKPEGVAKIEVARPVITDSAASYVGFTEEGVVIGEDGTYTVRLTNGRNIIRLTDASGRSAYQVVSAKPCHREITNLTREGSAVFQPGDKFKVQYSGLLHPANKIAGIYNMSAYVTYNGVPNGSSLILGAGQYTFGSAPSAQAVTVEIPDDYDVEKNTVWKMTEGVIQVNGYGDPIGNHRNTSPQAGRSPNFTAVPHQTYFGTLPDVEVMLSAVKYFDIALQCNMEDAEIEVKFDGKPLVANAENQYRGTFGTYSVTAVKSGYRCFRQTYTIDENAEGIQTFKIEMEAGAPGMWDGNSAASIEPDAEGVYHISTGAQLAFVAQAVNQQGSALTATAVLDNDIDLGDFEWTPIGTSSKPFSGTFDGNGYSITGLYIEATSTNTLALFGYVKGTAGSPASVANLTVEGCVAGKQYVGGIVANLNAYASIDRCANFADVSGTSYVGGVVGYISSASGASLTNSYNCGTVSGGSNIGGVAGYNNASAIISNIYNVGEIQPIGDGKNIGACVGGTTSKQNVTNAFAIEEFTVTDGHILVSESQMASGEVAYRLGEAFGQTIGEDDYPVLGGTPVYYEEETGRYYNKTLIVETSPFDAEEVAFDIYDLNGRLMLKEATVKQFRSLAKGFYILKTASEAKKILIK